MNKPAKHHQPVGTLAVSPEPVNPEPAEFDAVQCVLSDKLQLLEEHNHLSTADRILLQYALKVLVADLKSKRSYHLQLLPLIDRYRG